MSGRRRDGIAATAVAGSIVLSAAAQLLMKAGVLELGAPATVEPSAVPWGPGILVLAGLGAYALSMVAWLVALTRYQLSFAYPLLGWSYVIVYAVAVWLPAYGEEANWVRLAGIAMIGAGVALVTADGPGPESGRPAAARDPRLPPPETP